MMVMCCRLTHELKVAVDTQLKDLNIADLEPAIEEDQLLQNLQSQLQEALKVSLVSLCGHLVLICVAQPPGG